MMTIDVKPQDVTAAAKPPAPAQAPAKAAPAQAAPAVAAKPAAPAPAKVAPAPAATAVVAKPAAPAPAKPGAQPPARQPPAKPVVQAPAKAPPAPAKVIAPLAEPLVPLAHDLLKLDAVRLLRAQRNSFFLRVFFFVILPTLASVYYVYNYATPRYVSEFQVMYVPTATHASSSSSASSLLGGLLGGNPTIDYNRAIGTYILSPAALDIADKKLGLRAQYSSSSIDWLDRMPANASDETFLNYFQRRVNYWEQTGGFVTVDVEGFSQKAAQDLANTLVAAADEMVAKINMRPLLDQVEFTRKEKENYRKALETASDAVTVFREEHNDYDFTAVVAGLDTIVSNLKLQLAQARSQLVYERKFLNSDAPTTQALQAQISAIEGQISAERNRLASPSGAGKSTPAAVPAPSSEVQPSAPPTHDSLPYSQVMAKYLDLVQAQEFALKSYVSAETAYEAARLAAATQPAYAVTFVPPNLPNYSTAPNPMHVIPSTFLIALFTYAVGSLLIAMARDHGGA
jgi:capsular polysaccharide transport system permease protein